MNYLELNTEEAKDQILTDLRIELLGASVTFKSGEIGVISSVDRIVHSADWDYRYDYVVAIEHGRSLSLYYLLMAIARGTFELVDTEISEITNAVIPVADREMEEIHKKALDDYNRRLAERAAEKAAEKAKLAEDKKSKKKSHPQYNGEEDD